MLASDGVANVGDTGPGSITDTDRTRRARDGIHLVTVGYGMGNYNDHLMEQLADLGDGFYSYVDTYARGRAALRHDLTTTLTPVAAEARTQVAFDPELVTSYRLIGYDNREIADDDFTTSPSTPASSAPATTRPRCTRCGSPTVSRPGRRSARPSVKWAGRCATDADSVGERPTWWRPTPRRPAVRPLALAATVADLAQVLKHAAPYADRGVDLTDIRARAAGARGRRRASSDLVALAERGADFTRTDPLSNWLTNDTVLSKR